MNAKNKILADISHHAATQPRALAMPRRSPFTSVIAGAFHRHVGAGAHRDAHLRLRQRRRIVDAVAGHGDDVTFALQLLDDISFVGGGRPRLALRRCPVCWPPLAAVVRLSPVSMTILMPSACKSWIASGVLDLIGSATPSKPTRAGHRRP